MLGCSPRLSRSQRVALFCAPMIKKVGSGASCSMTRMSPRLVGSRTAPERLGKILTRCGVRCTAVPYAWVTNGGRAARSRMSDPGAEPRLVVPEGLVIDESARERLERDLARAPATVAGVAADCVALEPGASYRVDAEWTALDAP